MKQKFSYVAVFGAESAEPLSGTVPLVRQTRGNCPAPAENPRVRA